ncbi:MAG: hypothetical protein A3B68_07750 [Candidatus Melainabacteria bacterium RIFCSPHIGHO2_02_FULL_34_12]|nr:MAG: hypothetical protein A3B68_07750 [Candidatus Melainabacteria bacterium RIFCSPHIGHO2_02_FULL_34_12]
MKEQFISDDFKFPVTLAITGASGTVYGLRVLQFLLENNYRVEFVISESASKVALDEIGLILSLSPAILKEQVLSYLESKGKKNINKNLLNVWEFNDISASISSGSYRTSGMMIIPASMGTIGAIASGTSDNLITRAADVCLKERRKLVVVPREMPLNTIHLENLLKLSKIGTIIAPACPGFYHRPENLDEVIDFVAGKILDLFGFDHNLFKRWKVDSNLLAVN